MKSITEFAAPTLQKGLTLVGDLSTQGKSAEEISAAVGEAMKYEGDKLKHFINSVEVAKSITQGRLKRVLVVSFGESEKVPEKAVKVDDTHYMAEFFLEASAMKPVEKSTDTKGGKGRGKGRGNDRPQKRQRPADAAKTAEMQQYASSDGRAPATAPTTPNT